MGGESVALALSEGKAKAKEGNSWLAPSITQVCGDNHQGWHGSAQHAANDYFEKNSDVKFGNPLRLEWETCPTAEFKAAYENLDTLLSLGVLQNNKNTEGMAAIRGALLRAVAAANNDELVKLAELIGDRQMAIRHHLGALLFRRVGLRNVGLGRINLGALALVAGVVHADQLVG